MSEKLGPSVPGKPYLYFTAKCKVCLSSEAQAVTWKMIDGHRYQDIILDYPELKLSESMLSKHKRHYLEPGSIPLSESGFEESDHGFVDALRRLGFVYLLKALDGAALSMTEARIIQTSANSITGRSQIEDAQAQALSLQAVVEKAMKSKWKYAPETDVADKEAMRV